MFKKTNFSTIFPLSVEQCSLFVPMALYFVLLLAALLLYVPLHSKEHGVTVIGRIHYEGFSDSKYYNFQNNNDFKTIEKFNKHKLLSPPELLESIFLKVDKDNDGQLSIDEVSQYINLRTQEHIDSAMQENYGLFMSIDVDPRNGLVSWEEYHKYFLMQNGLSEDYANKHVEKHSSLDRVLKEAISRDKASWSEAARNDPDFLTLDEFLAFRHPESSHITILGLVEELLDKLDRNDDDILTEDEFAQLKVGDNGEALLSQGEKERREEFRTLVDTNSDGKADRKELVMYIDPKNPRHAKEEAISLVALADTSHDGKLSLQEVLSKVDLFLGSKMVDTARSFHDEF
ncbi:stromal cell derived factor mayday isoform X1 [Lycorma delicatula]|uniref:stromal cell derived factor mayday isoform X1 n=2 Tax=Lycorma delicatula TaxID=130591 RepID=UPI003F50D919